MSPKRNQRNGDARHAGRQYDGCAHLLVVRFPYIEIILVIQVIVIAHTRYQVSYVR